MDQCAKREQRKKKKKFRIAERNVYNHGESERLESFLGNKIVISDQSEGGGAGRGRGRGKRFRVHQKDT